jgi:DnaJ homolog subfamily A member 2
MSAKGGSSRSLYEILDVPKAADSNEIRRQYLKLSRVHHPDKVPEEKREEATARFKEINQAYEVLSDAQGRAYYDQTGQIPGEGGGGGPGGGPGPGGMPFHFNMGDLFGMFGGMKPPGAGNGRRSGRAPARKTQIAMTLKDFYYGRTLRVNLERQRFCPDCKGEGATNKKQCGDCNGQGMKTNIVQMGPMIMHNTGPCMACRGTGKSAGDACGGCSGSKFLKQEKTLEMVVQKGMRGGDMITFPGESSHSEGYEEPGDVQVELVAADEEHGWERAGDILRHRVGLSLAAALCGTRIVLEGHPGFDGGVGIDIPAGVQNRQEIIVEGLGMPRLGGGGFGDAVLVLSVVPTQQERELIEQKKIILEEVFQFKRPEVDDDIPLKVAKGIQY